MGVRAALGAGRARIASQLVTEGAVLAVAGGGLAVVLAFQGLRLVQAVGPGDIARLGEASVDGTVLLIAAGAAAIVTVMAAGIAPALLLTRGEVFRFLRAGSRAASGLGSGLRNSLVVTQFALAVTVVSGAALLTRSFVELQAVDVGFDVGGVVRFAVRLPDEQFTQVAREDFLRLLKDEVEAIPGVLSMGATTAAPFAQMRPSNFVARSDQEPDRQEDFQPVSWRAVTGDFFSAAGIPLLSGRVFGPQDRTDRGRGTSRTLPLSSTGRSPTYSSLERIRSVGW